MKHFKGIFLSRTREEALNQFTEFKSKWSSKYPKPVYNMEKNLSILLKYHDYPEPIRQSIHSTNIVECMNKEIRRRIKIIDSLPSEESAMKIIYLRSAEINEKWSLRSLRGFYNARTRSGKCSRRGILYKYTTFGTLCNLVGFHNFSCSELL